MSLAEIDPALWRQLSGYLDHALDLEAREREKMAGRARSEQAGDRRDAARADCGARGAELESVPRALAADDSGA
jgi:hypothetical protein